MKMKFLGMGEKKIVKKIKIEYFFSANLLKMFPEIKFWHENNIYKLI